MQSTCWRMLSFPPPQFVDSYKHLSVDGVRLTRSEISQKSLDITRTYYFRYKFKQERNLSWNLKWALNFWSIPHQTHSDSLFYWNLNNVNTRYIPVFSYWLPQFDAFIWFYRSVALEIKVKNTEGKKRWQTKCRWTPYPPRSSCRPFCRSIPPPAEDKGRWDEPRRDCPHNYSTTTHDWNQCRLNTVCRNGEQT